MKLLYLANNRIPSEKANGLQIVQMCQAFQRQGAEVTLVVPRRAQPKAMREINPFDYYGVHTRFEIDWLPCLDALEVAPAPLQPPSFLLQATSFGLSAAAYLARHPADAYYSRDPLSTVLMAGATNSIRRRTAYEAHTFPKQGPRRCLHLWAIGRLGRLVCISHGLASEYRSKGTSEDRILVAPDAVELSRFSTLPEKAKARNVLGIPDSARIVAYTGHLYPWKGAHTLALASRFLPPDTLVYIVGGTQEDLEAFRGFLAVEGLHRVRAVGHVSPDRVPDFLAAADILVIPNSGRTAASARYTSPMKLFEYMAARRPIVASRLPSLQEVLRDGDNSLLVEPDDPESLARAVVRVLSSEELGERIAGTAWHEVQGRSWDARAAAILDFLEV